MFGLKTLFGGSPVAHRQETGGARGGMTSFHGFGIADGLAAGTLVATAMGWRPAEAIARGDLVLTFDRGMQPVREVTRGRLWRFEERCPRSLWPLCVPAGALGNQHPMMLLPEQSVMLESDAADMIYGDPFTLVSAADLDGFRGIERVAPDMPALEVVQLHFDGDEVVYANAGALVHCPGAPKIALDSMAGADCSGYTVLPSSEAEMLLDCIADEDAVTGGWTPGLDRGVAYAAAAGRP